MLGEVFAKERNLARFARTSNSKLLAKFVIQLNEFRDVIVRWDP